MSKLLNLTGHRYNRLTVLSRAPSKNKANSVYWKCLCDCGKETIVSSHNLRSGAVKSCGCLQSEISSQNAYKRNFKHGEADTRLFNIWSQMHTRCENRHHVYYHRYGGRGIRICEEWNEYVPFATWARNNGYSDGLMLDRIDNDGNYEPLNCRWATSKQQSRNRGSNHRVTVNGVSHCLMEWAEINGISYNTILSRLRYGWDDVKAVSEPVKIKHERKKII